MAKHVRFNLEYRFVLFLIAKRTKRKVPDSNILLCVFCFFCFVLLLFIFVCLASKPLPSLFSYLRGVMILPEDFTALLPRYNYLLRISELYLLYFGFIQNGKIGNRCI